MSKVHVLKARGGVFSVVLHCPMPTGNNNAGNTWKSCWVNAGRAVTVLPSAASPGPGQISDAEKAQVEAGDVIEIVTTLRMQSGGGSAASVGAMADRVISDTLAQLSSDYAYFGYTQDT